MSQQVISQSALAKLLCGNIVINGDSIDEILNHLSTSIDNVAKELITIESKNSDQISLFAPFLGRSLLELGCTALIARLDPFRAMLLREYQQQPNYQLDKSNKSSIRWQGDILADRVPDIWADKSLQNPTRALLGDYYKTLIWAANFDKLQDVIADVSGDEWIVSLRQKTFERFYNETLTDFSTLYSEFSKGVHHELVIPLSSAFSRETIKQPIEKTIRNIATLGLFVSVINHTVNKLDIQLAITAYKEVQEMELF